MPLALSLGLSLATSRAPSGYVDILAGAGSFDTSTGLTFGAGWSVSAGKLIGAAPTASYVYYTIDLPAGTYRFVIDIDSIVTNVIQPRFTGGAQGNLIGGALSVPGLAQAIDLATTGSATVGFNKAAGTDCVLDNFRLYRIF